MKKILLFALLCLVGITSVQKAYAAKEIYAVKNGTTMVLYYDDQKSSRANVITNWTPAEGAHEMTWDECGTFTMVELDESMKSARPTSTRFWFYSFKQVTSITHLDYLVTSAVTDMTSMFNTCGVQKLDLSTFNTENVTSMRSMFNQCNVRELNLSSFNTSNVISMSHMFASCWILEELDISHFNTEKVRDMSYMFMQTRLNAVDLRNFSIASRPDVNNMFWNTSSLTTIYCNQDWSSLVAGMMFYTCPNIVGGNGTVYDPNHSDGDYARPDKPGQPGYFTSTVNYNEENGWLYYDDGNAVTPFGPGSGTFYWAVMYPANTVNSTSLDQIGVFVSGYNTDPISISIRQGGNTPKEATEIATISFRPLQSRGMETVSLSPAVTFNNSKNLWIVLSAPAGYPAVVCANTGDPNSRWYSMNGTTWGDLANTSSGGKKNDYSFMVRAHFKDLHEGIETTPSNSPAQGEKLLRDGQLLILVGDKTYDARGVEIKK